MTHKEKTEQFLHQHYHCSQALFGAFAKDFGLDLKTAFRISTCFGGGMRQGGTCGCITASLLVLGMAFGFYDSQDKEQEVYGNQKTEEFIKRFAQGMDGVVCCRDILGRDISKPEEMALVRKEGLILKKCPRALNLSIDILEDMLADYLKNIKETSIELKDIPENEMHPERGMIFPDQFIPVIEENGFIKRLDYYIWEEACRFIKRCEAAGINNCPVSVNVSRIHLRDNECIGILSDMIKEYSIPKKLLELEITETADDQQISMKALQLKEEGFTLLMDDFGSGYSSLNILLETPFDVIKLDRKFMINMMLSGKGRLILEQVITMADKLQLGVLAEGVETKEQVELLQNIGCDQVQGYYYAKPMPEDEFYNLLLNTGEEQAGN